MATGVVIMVGLFAFLFGLFAIIGFFNGLLCIMLKGFGTAYAITGLILCIVFIPVGVAFLVVVPWLVTWAVGVTS